MTRKTLLATALAGTMAFTSILATPATAAPDAEDYALTLLGLLAIGAIANAADDKNDRNREVTRGGGYWDHNDRGRHNRSRILPRRCEFETRTRRGWTDVLGESCLERHGVRVDRLPDRCEFQVRTERGRRTVFGSDCLEDRGYRIEPRRP